MGFGRWGLRDGNIRREITVTNATNFSQTSSAKFGTVALFTTYINSNTANLVRLDLSGNFGPAGSYFTTRRYDISQNFCSTYFQDMSENNYFAFSSDESQARARILRDNGTLTNVAGPSTLGFNQSTSIATCLDASGTRRLFVGGPNTPWSIYKLNLTFNSSGVISGFGSSAATSIGFTNIDNSGGNGPERAYYMNGTFNSNYIMAASTTNSKTVMLRIRSDLSGQYIWSWDLSGGIGTTPTHYGVPADIKNDYTTADASNNFYVISNGSTGTTINNAYIHKFPILDTSSNITNGIVSKEVLSTGQNLQWIICDPSANNIYMTDNNGRVFYIEKNFTNDSIVKGPFPLSVKNDSVNTKGGIYDQLNNYLVVPKGGTQNMLFFNLNKDQPN